MTDLEIRHHAYSHLDFNSPLSDFRADSLLDSLRPLAGARVVDLGCGWAELLLRLLAAEPTASGVGVDRDARVLDRARVNAEARGLSDRLRLERAEAATWTGGPADVVIVIGASHAFGGTRQALRAVSPLLAEGGRVLLGEGFWQHPPTPEALAALEAGPDDFGSLSELVGLAAESGYRPLEFSVASEEEWDTFESRWCGGLERWAREHPEDPGAGPARELADEHRTQYLAGYRGVFGLAYLTLVAEPSGR
ncbi:methyltransferase [Wenjunlia vitaminophila]|nr:methyltransferase domain-containing protein [Wenjunlia vitaminophila]